MTESIEDQGPSWERSLRQDEALGQALSLRWLSASEREQLRLDWLQRWDQIPYEARFHASCRDRLARCVPLATGARRARRLSQEQAFLVLVYDPQTPQQAWVSWSMVMPSLLWSGALARAEALMQVCAPYMQRPRASLLSLPKVLRLVKTGIRDLEQVAQVVSALELWMDDASWGSAQDLDPWDELPETPSTLEIARNLRVVMEQASDRFPSLSWRTLWSGACVRLEQHPAGMWVFHVRYSPAKDELVVQEMVQRLSGHLSVDLPLDLPLDALASLLRSGSMTMGYVDHLAQQRPQTRESRFDRAALCCALASGQPEVVWRLRQVWREAAQDADLLGQIAQLVSDYRMDWALFEVMALAQGDPLEQELADHLRPVNPQVGR